MTKVLVFESDSEFAQTLTAGLSAYGCSVTVVEDGEVGIDTAQKDKPDLILLTIELPRMNGFSVCNKLKRNGDLKTVPLALLSSEATEETFEQHKRLRTRADAYVHKPVDVDSLVSQLSELIVLTKQTGGEVLDDDDVLIEDLDVDEVAVEEASPSVLIDAETDDAFGNLMMAAGGAASPEAASGAVEDEVEMEDLELEDDGNLVVAPDGASTAAERVGQDEAIAAAVSEASSASNQQIETLNSTIATQNAEITELKASLEAALSAAESEADAKTQVAQKKDAEIELLQKELETLREKLESNESAGTAREFLDLREKLNRKDKEILDIRDELTSKEKALIRANDEAISVGREKADLIDQVNSLTNTKLELEKQNIALSQDKDQAQKRGDDFKSKSERLQSELDAKITELKQTLESHENEIATREAQQAALRVDHQEALVRAAEQAEETKNQAVSEAISQTREIAEGEKEAALVEAAEAARREREEALSAHAAELKSEHDGKMAALHRANEESMRKLRAELAYEKEQDLAAAAERLAQRERELNDEKDAALTELGNQKAEAERERDQRIGELEGMLSARTNERDEARATIEQREGTIAQLEASMASVRAELSEVTQNLQGESSRLAQAREKWQQDEASIVAAQEALSQALEQLQKTQERPIP